MYEVAKRISETEIVVIPNCRFFWKKDAQEAADTANKMEKTEGGIFNMIAGIGPKWTAVRSRDLDGLLKLAFMKAEVERLKDDDPKS